MSQLDNVIQQNAAAGEEPASMAEELSSQALQLTRTMSYFKIGGKATGNGASSRTVAGKGPRTPRAGTPPAPEAARTPTAIALVERSSVADEDFEQF